MKNKKNHKGFVNRMVVSYSEVGFEVLWPTLKREEKHTVYSKLIFIEDV
ncbi:MAG: hypothetical protein ACE5F7_01505 [Nitrospiria bacterium]